MNHILSFVWYTVPHRAFEAIKPARSKKENGDREAGSPPLKKRSAPDQHLGQLKYVERPESGDCGILRTNRALGQQYLSTPRWTPTSTGALLERKDFFLRDQKNHFPLLTQTLTKSTDQPLIRPRGYWARVGDGDQLQ
jgi:hypothetical protein